MRTTLSIDDRVLAAARSRAQRRNVSVGQALSELALIGHESETAATVAAVQDSSTFPRLPRVAGHVITLEMVDDGLDDE